jgi:hypothetical protein
MIIYEQGFHCQILKSSNKIKTKFNLGFSERLFESLIDKIY